MAAFVNANLPSEDEEDDDYAPEAEGPHGSRKTSLKRSRRTAQETSEEPAGPSEVAPEQHEIDESNPQQQAKKARIAAIWEQLNTKTTAKSQSSSQSASISGGLAALCQPVNSAKANPDKLWMRSLGMATDAKGLKVGVEGNDMKSVAAKALAAAKEAASLTAGKGAGRVLVTETRKFAGKDVQMTREVDKDSKEAAKVAEKKPTASSGLDALLAEMDQKKKVNVLDKSKADWQEFKKADNVVEEELEAYKRSSTQYLDKQQFLQRAELREYEQEREKRLNADVRTRGRL